jgi:hypothetical protein
MYWTVHYSDILMGNRMFWTVRYSDILMCIRMYWTFRYSDILKCNRMYWPVRYSDILKCNRMCWTVPYTCNKRLININYFIFHYLVSHANVSLHLSHTIKGILHCNNVIIHSISALILFITWTPSAIICSNNLCTEHELKAIHNAVPAACCLCVTFIVF